jgi:biopolymer transport protein TolR
MRRNRRRLKQAIALPEINLMPLIDTALTLLVIFMVATPMMQQGIKVDLPQGKSQEIKDQKQELVVFVDKNEKLFLNEVATTFDKLIEDLKKQVTPQSEKTVFVKADKSVHYGKVIEVVDQIKYVGGIKYVALATQRTA